MNGNAENAGAGSAQGGMNHAMPSVGRIVHYIGHSMGADIGDKGQSHPAIITKVHSADCVNLVVFFDCAASAGPKSSAVRGQHWVWPPRV